MSYDLSPPFLVLQSPRLPNLSNYITPTFYRRHVPDLQTLVYDIHLSSRLRPIMIFQGAMLSLQSGEWCDCLNITYNLWTICVQSCLMTLWGSTYHPTCTFTQCILYWIRKWLLGRRSFWSWRQVFCGDRWLVECLLIIRVHQCLAKLIKKRTQPFHFPS